MLLTPAQAALLKRARNTRLEICHVSAYGPGEFATARVLFRLGLIETMHGQPPVNGDSGFAITQTGRDLLSTLDK